MTSKATRHYETYGSVRGKCGHKHRSIRTATACLLRDRRGCESQGGYSDRDVIAVENDKIVTFYATDDEGHTWDPDQEER